MKGEDVIKMLNNIECCLDILQNGITDDVIKQCINLLESGASSLGERFLQAYFIEHSNPRKAYKLYRDLENKLFGPACLRIALSIDSDQSLALVVLDKTIFMDEFEGLIFESFEATSDPKYGLGDYCLGVACYMGLDFPERKNFGVELIVDSAKKGCRGAQRAAFQIYDSEESYIDKEKALMWLEKIFEFDSDVAVDLANRYLDGIGCRCSIENDKKAYSVLASKENSSDRIAINNLGWLYKTGRGCDRDYKKARLLFEHSAEMGSSASLYHLGEICENGLGVDADVNLAKRFYEKAAEMGNKRAKERLKKFI